MECLPFDQSVLMCSVPNMHPTGTDATKLPKHDRVYALYELALLHASRSCEITLSDSRRLRSTLAAAPVLFA